ncbi:MAG TPA: site-2 protease family protein [Oryzihumus sp.]|nr:site-2 protease family protein [Oryzihumus sp.]
MTTDGAAPPQRAPGLRIATLAGIPVYIGRTWPIIAVVILVLYGPSLQASRPDLGSGAYLVAAAFALLLLVSVLAHEAAHALVARAFGYRVSRVVADLWGGHTAYESAGKTPGASALVAVVGPATNGVLAVIAWQLSHLVAGGGVAHILLAATAWTNAFVAVFNVLPGLPLDGGFIVDAVVWKVTGRREAGLTAAGWSGRVVAVLTVVFFLLVLPVMQNRPIDLVDVVWGGMISAFLWAGATQAVRAGRTRGRLNGVLVDAVWRRVTTLPLSATAQDAYALRTSELGGAAVVVVDPTGAELGLVDDDALRGIPEPLLASTPVSAVMRAQPSGWVALASPSEPVTTIAETMQRLGVDAVPVRVAAGAPLAGIVLAGDLEDALSRRPRGRT